MKNRITLSLLVLFGITTLNRCDLGESYDPNADSYSAQSLALMTETIEAFEIDSLDAAEASGLILMREEEKLARDVYLHLYETWGLKIFRNISNSEATHMAAIKILLDRYELVDPLVSDLPGEYSDETFTTLYQMLTAQGDSGLIQALTVGATIEDLDIKDLMDLAETCDNDDILYTYDNLTKGSRNHMRSFYGLLERNGGDYEAVYISEALLDSIVESPKEVGNW